MNPRRQAALWLLPLLAFLLQACTADGGKAQPPRQKLRVVVLPFLSYAPLFIAQEEGFFAQQGFEVEFVKLQRSMEAIPALDDGSVDVAGSFVTAGFLNAVARGARIRFVANKGYIRAQGCAEVALLARRSLLERGELDTPSELRQRRIAVDPLSSGGYYADKLLRSVGVRLRDLQARHIPWEVLNEAFRQGTIDLALATEPWVTRAVQAGDAVVWMAPSRLLPGADRAFLVYGRNFLDRDVSAGRRFMTAYLQAVRQYNQGKTARNLEILAKYTELAPEFIRQTCWMPLREDGQIDAQSVLDFNRWALEQGRVSGLLKPEQFWDGRFLAGEPAQAR